MYEIAKYGQHLIYVSFEDREIVRTSRWRVDQNGYAVASAPKSGGDPHRKRNLRLARVVADRMGLPAGQVGYLDGAPLNCQRENLFIRRAAHGGAGHILHEIQNPPGLHRHRAGDERPASYYSLCSGLVSPAGTCTAVNVVATATRVPRGKVDLWAVRLPSGERFSPVLWKQIKNLVVLKSDSDQGSVAEHQSAVRFAA